MGKRGPQPGPNPKPGALRTRQCRERKAGRVDGGIGGNIGGGVSISGGSATDGGMGGSVGGGGGGVRGAYLEGTVIGAMGGSVGGGGGGVRGAYPVGTVIGTMGATVGSGIGSGSGSSGGIGSIDGIGGGSSDGDIGFYIAQLDAMLRQLTMHQQQLHEQMQSATVLYQQRALQLQQESYQAQCAGNQMWFQQCRVRHQQLMHALQGYLFPLQAEGTSVTAKLGYCQQYFYVLQWLDQRGREFQQAPAPHHGGDASQPLTILEHALQQVCAIPGIITKPPARVPMHGAEADGRIPETLEHGVGQSPEAPQFDLFNEASPDDDEVAAVAERDAMALQVQLTAAEAAAEAAAEGIREPTSQEPPSQEPQPHEPQLQEAESALVEPTDAVADAWSDRAADEAANEAAPAADEADAFRATEKVDGVDEEQGDDNLEEDNLPYPHACPNKAEKDDEARAASVAIAGSIRMVKPHEEAGPEDAAEAVVVVGEEVDGAMAAIQQQRAPEDSDEGGDPLAPPPFYVSGDAIPSDAVAGMRSSGTYRTRRGEVRHIEAAAALAVSQSQPAAATASEATGPSPRPRGPSPGIDEEEEELPPTTAMGPPVPPNPEGAPALPPPLSKKAIVALTADEPREAPLARGLDDDDDARGPSERVATERVAAERVEAERVAAERVEAERVEAERVEAERVEAERVEAERSEAERAAAERVEAERVEAERAAAERAAAKAAAPEVAAAESKSVISKAAAKAVANSAAAETAAAAKPKASSDKEKADKAKAKAKRLNSGDKISINLCDSDAENEGTTAKPAAGRRSSRIASSACKPGDAELLHFPSKDAKEYITLTYADVRRLESRLSGAPPETLLLNDNLVDLYIKHLSGPPQQLCTEFMPRLDETSRSRVHVFNAFFLKKLEDTITQGLGMHKMMKWVRGVDLLAKDFLFVPVHEQRDRGHWALAVICCPGLVTRPPPPLPATPLATMTDACASSAASTEVSEALPHHGGLAAIDGGSNAIMAVSVGSSSGSGSRGVEGDSGGGGSEGSVGEGSGASGIARPCILFFDSSLQSKNKVLFAHLRAFLEYYWASQFESRRIEGYPRSGQPLADEPLPPPLKRAHAATGSDGGAQGPQAKRQCALLEATPLFSKERMPNIILKNVPQQENDYDCGLYMLSSIEHLAAAEELPSFETAEGLIAHFSGATLPQQKAIDKKRANFYKGVFRLAEAQSQPDDPIMDSDSDGEKELEELRPSKRQRGGGTASDTAPSTADTKIGGPAESPPASASSSAAHGKRRKGLASTEPAAASASKDVRRAGGVAAELASIIRRRLHRHCCRRGLPCCYHRCRGRRLRRCRYRYRYCYRCRCL